MVQDLFKSHPDQKFDAIHYAAADKVEVSAKYWDQRPGK